MLDLLNFIDFSNTSLIFDLKMSLDRGFQDLNLCFVGGGGYPQEMTSRTLEQIFQNLRQI